jgi:excisionase family DNA binding protein
MPISYSVLVAAKESGLCERTLREAIKDGRLTALRVGRRVLIKPEALREYLDGKTGERKAGAQ